jgi:hypothetical protein
VNQIEFTSDAQDIPCRSYCSDGHSTYHDDENGVTKAQRPEWDKEEGDEANCGGRNVDGRVSWR